MLVVDDEQPILDELTYLLGKDDRIGTIHAAVSGTQALRALSDADIAGVFLDIAMPCLDGMDVARIIGKFQDPPKVVFITAHEDHAVEAFDLNAVDFLLKPIREDRLGEAVRRMFDAGAPTTPSRPRTIAVELGGVTRFIPRSEVVYAEAEGDYVRLHVVGGDAHLIRSTLGALEHDWSDLGLVRIHRSLLVSPRYVREVRVRSGHSSVIVEHGTEPVELGVSRRHAHHLRPLLAQRARRS